MYSTAEFRKGLKIEFKGKPFVIVDFQHVKPGKGGAFVRTKIKNLETGQVLDETFRSGAKVGKPDLEEKKVQYLYQEGASTCSWTWTPTSRFSSGTSSWATPYPFLMANLELSVLFFQGKTIGVDLPVTVELLVTETEPGVKGDTATGATKAAPWRPATWCRCRCSSRRGRPCASTPAPGST